MKYLQAVLAITYKDLISEFRSRESLSSMLMFSILVVIIFSFSFDPGSGYATEAAPGILWVSIAFAGIIGLNRSFVYEADKGCLHGLLLTPIDRSVIYFGKMLSNIIFLFIVEIFTLPVFLLFFNLEIQNAVLPLLSVLFTASLGFSAVGTLLSAMAVNTKTRDVMLPILLFPVFIPILLAAVNATRSIFLGDGWDGISTWLNIIISFDVIFLALCYILFEYVIDE